MTPHCGAHSTRLQQHIVPLSMTSIRAITNSTELCPVNSVLIVTKHYECRGVYHSFNKLFAIKLYSLFVCLFDTHTSISLRHRFLNLHYHVVPLHTPNDMCYVSPPSSVHAICLSASSRKYISSN